MKISAVRLAMPNSCAGRTDLNPLRVARAAPSKGRLGFGSVQAIGLFRVESGREVGLKQAIS